MQKEDRFQSGQNVQKRTVPNWTFCPKKNRPQLDKRSKKMPNWTNEQKQAIYEKGNNTLVAAAARKRKNSSFSRKND